VKLPAHGRSAASILDELDAMQAEDVDWKSGRAFSLAYYPGPDVYALASEACARFQSSNALNTAAFPSLRRMQAEVVAMMSDLLHGGDEAAGFMTSGGTESILLAVKAARGRGHERGITTPEMVLPTSAHAAFEKAAAYFGVRSVRVPVRDDFRADVSAMRDAVTANTVLLVGSAPQYPQGVVDPIAEIAAIAAERGVNCHVDACMGGVTLPMLERLGYPVPPFDFRVPGVTSISVDLHKYGYTAKGASVLLHRNKELRRHQTFVTDNWLGGLYGSSGILGTKSGGPIAAAWAVMTHLGEEGAEPDATLLSFACDDPALDAFADGSRRDPSDGRRPDADASDLTFAIGDALAKRGWVVDQQKPPPSLHCTVNAAHGPVIPEFLATLREVVDEQRGRGGKAAQQAYGTVE